MKKFYLSGHGQNLKKNRKQFRSLKSTKIGLFAEINYIEKVLKHIERIYLFEILYRTYTLTSHGELAFVSHVDRFCLSFVLSMNDCQANKTYRT